MNALTATFLLVAVVAFLATMRAFRSGATAAQFSVSPDLDPLEEERIKEAAIKRTKQRTFRCIQEGITTYGVNLRTMTDQEFENFLQGEKDARN